VKGVNRSSLAWGTVFCILGAALLLEELGVWRVRVDVLVPVLLIAAGVVVAVSAAFPSAEDR
jgi:hypothetical protein